MDTELEHAIITLNEAFFGSAPADFTGFEYHTNGDSEAVYFMGVPIWSSDDSPAHLLPTGEYGCYNYDLGKDITYFHYLKQEALYILDVLAAVKRKISRMKE